jgi:hypothetical protein
MRATCARFLAAAALSLGLAASALAGATAAGASDAVPPASLLSWSAPQSDISPTGFALQQVACVSATFCMASDGPGHMTTFNGQTWSAPMSVTGSGGFIPDLSCPSASFCAATTNTGVAFYRGTAWNASRKTPLTLPRAISCTSSTFCLAADGAAGSAITYNGRTWSAPVSFDTKGYLNSVSCASPTFCVALDMWGRAFRYNGTKWSGPVTLAAGSLQNQIYFQASCTRTKFCAVIGGSGDDEIIGYNGTAWSTPVVLHKSLISVSCTTATFCVSVDSLPDGDAIQSAGAVKGTAQHIDTEASPFLVSVSCSSTTFCVALDTAGYYMVGR